MKNRSKRAIGISALMCLCAGCAAPRPDPTDSAPKRARFSTVAQFDYQTVTFQLTRNDFSVGRAVFSVYCSNPDAVRVNGVTPDPLWRDIRVDQTGAIEVIERHRTAPEKAAWFYINLPSARPNQFQFGPLKIESAGPELAGLICMSLKIWFNEVPNEFDGLYYQNLDDRYALVSFCTHPPDPRPVRSRFDQNRVATIREFQEKLGRPISIKLNQRALRKDWPR